MEVNQEFTKPIQPIVCIHHSEWDDVLPIFELFGFEDRK
jgi:hypothetical protein